MNMRIVPAAVLGFSALIGISFPAEAGQPPTWKKTVVEAKFRSEGVGVADVNKDGKNDILNGDFWYEAPTWTKHEIRKPGDFGDGLHSYSKCMAVWTDDINKDGWLDQIVVGFPGDAAIWYENPKNDGSGHWKAHEIWHSACNETPIYADLFGTGQRVLVMGWQPRGKDNEGTMAWFAPAADPTSPWEMHAVSELGGPQKMGIPGTQKFSHGLGVGDLNGDGREDLLLSGASRFGVVLAGQKGLKFKTLASYESPRNEARFGDLIVGDLNADGQPDIVLTDVVDHFVEFATFGADNDLTRAFAFKIFEKKATRRGAELEPRDLALGDVDGDGRTDLILIAHDRVLVYRQDPGQEPKAKEKEKEPVKAAEGK